MRPPKESQTTSQRSKLNEEEVAWLARWGFYPPIPSPSDSPSPLPITRPPDTTYSAPPIPPVPAVESDGTTSEDTDDSAGAADWPTEDLFWIAPALANLTGDILELLETVIHRLSTSYPQDEWDL